MNKTLRWVLVAALVVALICLAAGAALVVFRGGPTLLGIGPRMMNPAPIDPRIQPPFDQGPDGRMPFGRGPHGFLPFASRGGFGGIFGLGFTLFRLAIPLLVISLIVLLVFLLIRRSSPALLTSTPAAAAAPPIATTTPCPNCARPVQTDWVACPYCGHGLQETL